MKRLLLFAAGVAFLGLIVLEGWGAERAERRAAEKKAAARS